MANSMSLQVMNSKRIFFSPFVFSLAPRSQEA